jgi:hypothetical protein
MIDLACVIVSGYEQSFEEVVSDFSRRSKLVIALAQQPLRRVRACEGEWKYQNNDEQPVPFS